MSRLTLTVGVYWNGSAHGAPCGWEIVTLNFASWQTAKPEKDNLFSYINILYSSIQVFCVLIAHRLVALHTTRPCAAYFVWSE